MGTKISRRGEKAPLMITNDVNTTDEIDFHEHADLLLYLPPTWTTCTVTFYAKNPQNNAWVPIQSWDGTSLSNLTMDAEASKAIKMPDEAFAAYEIKVVSDNAANNTENVGITAKG